MKAALIFLISVLILGISSQTPFLSTNGETDLIGSKTYDMQIPFNEMAFAESGEEEVEEGEIEEEDEIEELEIEAGVAELEVKAEIVGEQVEVKVEREFSTTTTDRDAIIDEIIQEFTLDRETADAALEIETVEEEELEEEFKVEVEVEEGIAEVEVKLKFILGTTDREAILDAIVERTQLTREQIGEGLEFENEETEEELEEETEETEETEIEVEVKKGKAKVRIEFNDQKSRFALDTTAEAEILAAIAEITGLTESEIKDIWEFEIEDEVEEEVDEEEIMEQETEAEQRALEMINELKQKIEQLEDRLQSLLSKLETGEYFGPTLGGDPVTKSYNLSFDGSATSIGDSTVSDITGEIFFESLVSREHVSKFRITGGDVVVGDTIYDLVFGKARATSSGPSGEQDSMIIIAHMLDDEGNGSTLKILLESVNLEAELGSELAEVTIMTPQSKIAGKWFLSGSGQLSLT